MRETILWKAVASLQNGTDEELDRAGEYQNTAMAANSADTILQFLLFGLAADGSNPGLAGKLRRGGTARHLQGFL